MYQSVFSPARILSTTYLDIFVDESINDSCTRIFVLTLTLITYKNANRTDALVNNIISWQLLLLNFPRVKMVYTNIHTFVSTCMIFFSPLDYSVTYLETKEKKKSSCPSQLQRHYSQKLRYKLITLTKIKLYSSILPFQTSWKWLTPLFANLI